MAKARTAKPSAESLATILERIREKPPTKELAELVRGLATGPTAKKHDPRITDLLLGMLEEPPYTSGSLRPMWRSVFEQLIGPQADASAVARLRAVDISRHFGSTNMAGWLKDAVDDALVTLCERYPEAAKAPKPARPKVVDSAPKKPLSTATREVDLLLAVAQRLDDDDARRVYADFVAERGDETRAELIHLQLDRGMSAPSAREGELLSKHAAKWLAPIVPVLKKDAWSFSRGFLDTCVIYPRKGAALELAGHPLWSTVTAATLSETGDPAPIVTHPIMSNLRRVKLWTYPRGLLGLLDSDAPIEQLHHIYIPNVIRDKTLWRAFLDGKRLPRLRAMEIIGLEPEQAQTIFSGGFGRPGLRFLIGINNYRVASWLTHVEAPQPYDLTLVTRQAEIDVASDKRVIWTVQPGEAVEGLGDLAIALGVYRSEDGLPTEALPHIELRIPAGDIPGARTYGNLRTAAELLPAIEQRAATLRIGLTTVSGPAPMRYLGKNKLEL